MSDNEQAQQVVTLSREEFEEVIKKTMNETFLALGVDTTKPICLQKDFSYLRNLRESNNTMRTLGISTVLVTFIGGMGTALLIGIKEYLHKGA